MTASPSAASAPTRTPNMAKRVLLGMLGAAAGAASVASTVSHGASAAAPDAGGGGSGTTPIATGVNGTFTGDAALDGRWGTVTVTITVKNNRIVDSSMSADVHDMQSQYINTQMTDWNSGKTVPEALRQQALQSQSAQISGVSGATFSSYAYSQSLQSAISRAGL